MSASDVKQTACTDLRKDMYKEIKANTAAINQFRGGFWVARYLVPTLIILAITVGSLQLASLKKEVREMMHGRTHTEKVATIQEPDNTTP